MNMKLTIKHTECVDEACLSLEDHLSRNDSMLVRSEVKGVENVSFATVNTPVARRV